MTTDIAIRDLFTGMVLLTVAVIVLACAALWLYGRVCRTEGMIGTMRDDLYFLKTELRRPGPEIPTAEEVDEFEDRLTDDPDFWKRR